MEFLGLNLLFINEIIQNGEMAYTSSSYTKEIQILALQQFAAGVYFSASMNQIRPESEMVPNSYSD